MKQHVFILNPQAGFRREKQLKEMILRQFGPDAEIRLTRGPGDAARIAGEYRNAILYAVGGDGTANEVMCGTVGTENTLCVVPAGSGNDFVRTLYRGLPVKEQTAERILREVPGMEEQKIDCGKINGTYFMNIASVGFDAQVVKNSERFENIPGLRKISYILSIFYTIFHYRGADLEVETDGRRFRQKALLCCIANGRYYGGGVRIAPEANLSDGVFQTYLVDSMHPLRFLTLLPKLLRGTHTKIPCVKRIPARKITIRGQDLLLNIDGELSRTDCVQIELLPSALKILVPKGEIQ